MRFLERKNWILLKKIAFKFVPKDPVKVDLSLVQVMAWPQTGDELLPEAMMTQVAGPIYVLPVAPFTNMVSL